MEKELSEKHPPEKQLSNNSDSYVNKENGTNIITNLNANHDDHPETETCDLLVSQSPKTEVKVEESDNISHEIEEVHQEEKESDEKIEDSPRTHPEINYTIETVSLDIDQFLITLSSTPKDAIETIDGESKEEKDGKVSIEIPVFVEKNLDLVEEKVANHDLNEGKRKWGQNPEEDSSFLEGINRISKLTSSIDKLRPDPNRAALINRIGGIQQQAMTCLENEFKVILEDIKHSDQDPTNDAKGKQLEADHSVVQESESIETDNVLGCSDYAVSILNRIAKAMIEGGFESECCQLYMMIRGQAFDECFIETGFEKISIDEVQRMPWEALEREIPIWIKAVKECASIYFVEELKLAEAIFSDYSSISSSLFSNLIRTVMIQLLNFAEGVAMTKRSAEKLFKFLDMYETLRDSLPAMGALFSEEYENELKTETTTARCRIGEAAIYIFCDLENSIKSDTGKTPVPGGAVHPLTLYTMNYLKYGGEYKATLEQVFREHSKIERADSTSRPRFEGETQNSNNDIAEENQSPFSNQLMRVMDLLDSNLGAKSKLYKDIALSCIFMMNNGRYIVQKIKGSTEIHQMIGDTWCRRKSSELRNYHKNYQRETWSKLLSCLGHEGLQVNGKVIKPVLKERFKSFNMLFDEIHKTQSSWVVSDDQLQSELRVSISAVVIPAYRSFLGRFSQYLTSGRQSEKYIKYQAEDLETSIDELFDGNPASVVRKRP
jgi:exocyst complex protein 7